jgi:hypothetical protein
MSPKKIPVPTFMLILAAGAIACASASLLTHSVTITSTVAVANGSTFQITVHVSASYDDAGAWWDPRGWYWLWTLDESHVSVGGSTGQYNGGLRFVGVDIPRGAQIVSAVLKVCSDVNCEGITARWNIYGENVGDSAEFSTKEDFDTRPKTMAVKDTGFFTVWVEGTWYQVDGLSSVVQEIINRPDWNSGNALTLLLLAHPESGTTHEVRSYDANPSEAAILEIAYKT